jgi:YggT family protein
MARDLWPTAAPVKRNGASGCGGGPHRLDQRERFERPRMTSLFEILMMLLSVAQTVIIVHIIMSWLINFGVLNLHQPLVAQIWDGLNRLLEPVYGPIRRALPNMGGLDLAPLIVILGIFAIRTVLINNATAFY